MFSNNIFSAISDVTGMFNESIIECVNEYEGEGLPYLWCSSQLRYAVDKFAEGDSKLLDNLIILTDSLLNNGDHSVREFGSVRLIEDMQNTNIVSESTQRYILGKLTDRCRVAWDDVGKFWNREIPIIPDRG